ncbi:MAG: NlpC/P60 family protein [Sphingobacteriia bacterium]|nr:MAG: NlpC/P60 family protein [Sphingobacteriia bacterium]
MMAMTGTVPMRSEAAHRSEMTNQLLFGELAHVLAISGDFVLVQTQYENYEGWCQKSQLLAVPATWVSSPPQPEALAGDFAQLIQVNGEDMRVPLGSNLRLFQNNQLALGAYVFDNKGTVHVPQAATPGTEAMVQLAKSYLNTPYLWGGRSVFGIDCSGFTQQVFRFFGQYLPRDAYQQAELGRDLGFLAEGQSGDLAFFDNAAGKITHVGMLLGPQTIVHASGKVRIDPIDQEGILHAITGERTHHLRLVKRYTA